MKNKTPEQLGEESIEEINRIVSKTEWTWLDKKTLINLALNEQRKMLSVCGIFISSIKSDEYESPTYIKIKETIEYLENLLK